MKISQNEFNKKIFIILLLVTLSSCGTLKEGFKSQKKDNTDEFLVKKISINYAARL